VYREPQVVKEGVEEVQYKGVTFTGRSCIRMLISNWEEAYSGMSLQYT